jgi:hypothetical protein
LTNKNTRDLFLAIEESFNSRPGRQVGIAVRSKSERALPRWGTKKHLGLALIAGTSKYLDTTRKIREVVSRVEFNASENRGLMKRHSEHLISELSAATA